MSTVQEFISKHQGPETRHNYASNVVSYLQAYGYNFQALATAVTIFNNNGELMLRLNSFSGVLNNH
jgi:hypothetical protein